MATLPGIWNAASTTHASPSVAAAASTSSSSSTSDSAGISANDFLTLLVTELKNQDPTTQTDPNQWVDQLVQVNSLEQLININQTLTTDLGPATAQNGAGTPLPGRVAPTEGAAAAQISPVAAAQAANGPGAIAGNLTVPAGNPAAQRVAEALGAGSSLR